MMHNKAAAFAAILFLWLGTSTQAFAANLAISTDGNNLAFDKTVLKVKPGEAVTLTFKNASDPGSDLKHTWVLVKPGTQEDIAAKAPAAGATKDYIPDDPNVIAHTRLLKPGESQTIRFKAPMQAGSYPYLCTFPAHSGLLKGTLQVG